jgi:hypothetical protein
VVYFYVCVVAMTNHGIFGKVARVEHYHLANQPRNQLLYTPHNHSVIVDSFAANCIRLTDTISIQSHWELHCLIAINCAGSHCLSHYSGNSCQSYSLLI